MLIRNATVRFLGAFATVWVMGVSGSFGAGGDSPADAGLAGSPIYVSPGGDDANSGASPVTALRTPAAAVSRAVAGTIVYFDAGTYPPLVVTGKAGRSDAPIVFRTVPGLERQATFTSGSYEKQTAIHVTFSSYVEIHDLRASRVQKGIAFEAVSHGVIMGNVVEDIGQEAIHVGRPHTYGPNAEFRGPVSEYVRIAGNAVRGTGKVKPDFGEGVYIGSGTPVGDETHDVTMEYNTLTDIGAEGVESKPGTHNVTIRGNAIWNTHHEYNAAITVAVEGSPTADGNYLIEDNLVWDIHQVKHGVAGIAIGQGNAIIWNNIIWGVQGGIGIRVYETFANPQTVKVTLTNNTIWAGPEKRSISLTGTTGGPPTTIRPVVRVDATLTTDGRLGSVAAAPGAFVGPLTGDADAGQGPGSGFRLRRPGTAGADYPAIRRAIDAYKSASHPSTAPSPRPPAAGRGG